MAAIANPNVDSSLWFDSFSLLLTDLENLPISADLPPSMVDKLKENRGWFLNTVTQFKTPSQTSKDALNSQQVTVGSHNLNIKPHYKDLALKLSSTLCLDEIQSYILVQRFLDNNAHSVDGVQGFFLEIVLQYYTERQCLLKCVRHIIIHALNVDFSVKEAKAIWQEVVKIFSDGLEGKLISMLARLLSSSYPEHMDVDLYILWAEEMLIEDNLVLDLLFLAYYESLCTCSAAKWQELCMLYKDMTSASSNFVKMGVSAEALKYIYRAKIQMLLVLIETLDFESLLQMIHDEIPLRDDSSMFSSSSIVEMDSVISSFDIFETQEVGLLILAWAVFLCLVTSLPGKEEHNELMEIDHVGYVRQAFEAASLSFFWEILQSDILKDSDGPVTGYRSILRTFISAFIASYEINIQLEDDTLRLMLTILCEIYRGEELLCVQFWDKDSVVDGPIRCLLRSLEGEFPYRTVELTQFLSALSEGSWPAECVYNFMEKSIGISTVLDLSSHLVVGGASQIVETQLPLPVPAVEGLVIPSKTRGHVLRMIDSRTALVRWEYKQSGLLVLLLRIAQVLEKDGNEEVLVVLDLFSRLASFNVAVCYSLMNIGKVALVQANYSNEKMDNNVWIDIVEVLCNLVRNLSPYCGSVLTMSKGVTLLAKMMRCSPSHVSTVVMKMNIFDLSLKTSIFNDQSNGLSSSWLLSGRLAKMLLVDCEHNGSCPLTISVLEFTMQLLQAGLENDFVLALVIFCLQYVFVNHEYWKYKEKQDRWKVTLKGLEVMKMCIISIPSLAKIGGTIRDLILSDSSIHSMFLRIICTTMPALEKLYVSRLYDWKEIDGLRQAICSVLDILVSVLSSSPEDEFSGFPILHQAVLSTSTKPVPVVVALSSLMSYFRDPAIQVRAAAVLSTLCLAADLSGNANFGLTSKQIVELRHSIENIICKQSERNEELFIAVIKLLSSAANHQPAFLIGLFAGEDIRAFHSTNNGSLDEQTRDSTAQALKCENVTHLVDVVVQFVERSDTSIQRNAQVLLSILHFIRALWQGAAQYADFVESVRKSKKFWKHLTESVILICRKKIPSPRSLSEVEAQKFAYTYQCQSAALDIMALEIFLQKKLLHAELLVRQADEPSKGIVAGGAGTETQLSTKLHHLEDILSSWYESNELIGLLKSSSACVWNTDIYFHAKIAGALLAVHLIAKLSTGDSGSLRVPFVEKVTALSTKLINLPAFAELCTQYSRHGYSEGTKIESLILSDLYYHLQGELEGRDIENSLFKELSQFLINSDFILAYKKQHDQKLLSDKLGHLFDLSRLRQDTGLDIWEYSEWISSKKIAETMLLYLQSANSMLLLVSSRLQALRALVAILTLNKGDSVDGQRSTLKRISEDGILSCIDHVCKEFCTTVGIVSALADAPQEVLNFLAAQAELLICLAKHVDGKISSPTSLVILKTCSFSLKQLCDSTLPVTEVKLTLRSLLMLLFLVVKFGSPSVPTSNAIDNHSEPLGEVSNICLSMLPVLCRCTEFPDQSIISLAIIDLIIKRFLTPSTWLPIIQQRLQFQQLIAMLHDKSSLESHPVILKFFLTLASVREGAEMLLASGLLSFLRVLFVDVSEGGLENSVRQGKKSTSLSNIEKPLFIWGLGLAVFTAIVHSLGQSSRCADVVDDIISFFFSEKAHMIAYHLSAPDIRSDNHDKKRARAQKRQSSLSAFREIEYTLMLISALAKQRNSWRKGIKEMGSELRERIIHLLAFISRADHHVGELPTQSSLLCLPMSKEEIECCKRPTFMNSRSAWFAIAAHGCIPALCDESLIEGQANRSEDPVTPTYFSDTVAVQIYRITFVILKFLCLQADDGARRAEELGFLDLSQFPELPDPDILHGLQDQSIAIVTEVCEANKSKQIQPDAQNVCLLLLKVLEMALYLELSVSQICGIRPVLGRVEDFTKEMRLLVRATEEQKFLKSSMKHLKQIVSVMYPALLQSEGIL